MTKLENHKKMVYRLLDRALTECGKKELGLAAQYAYAEINLHKGRFSVEESNELTIMNLCGKFKARIEEDDRINPGDFGEYLGDELPFLYFLSWTYGNEASSLRDDIESFVEKHRDHSFPYQATY